MPDNRHSVPSNATGFYPMDAIEWRVGPEPSLTAPYGLRDVRIVKVSDGRGGNRFAVREGLWCANKDRQWELEPIPSSRDDEFMERCRWDEWEDAALVAQTMVRAMLASEWPVAS